MNTEGSKRILWVGLASCLISSCGINEAGKDGQNPTSNESVSHATLEAGQAAALEQERLDALWANVASVYPDAERPSAPKVVRTIKTSEWPDVQARCLQDSGYPVERMDDGGLSFGQVPVQDLNFHIALYTCEAQFPPEPHSLLPPSDEYFESLYTYRTGPLIECLRGRGYAAPDPPSLQTFIEQQRSGAPSAWSPYSEISQTVGQDEWMSLNRECPQSPVDQ